MHPAHRALRGPGRALRARLPLRVVPLPLRGTVLPRGMMLPRGGVAVLPGGGVGRGALCWRPRGAEDLVELVQPAR